MGNHYEKLSYTKIARYVKCPAQYKFYIDNLKILPSDQALSGSNLHINIAEALLDDTILQSKFGERLKLFCKYILRKPHGIEEKFSIDFITSKLEGIIDAYSIFPRQAVIVDWKSNPGMSEELQLKLYALALKEQFPEIESFHCYFFYVNQDYYEPYTFFRDEIDEFSNSLAAIMDKITTDKDFYARPGTYCKRCHYVENHCPVAKQFEIPPLITAESIIELGKRTYILEGILEKTKDKIKEYMVEHSIDSLPINAEHRFYLTSSIALRFGKNKSEKDKKGDEKIIEIAKLPVARLSDNNERPEVVKPILPACKVIPLNKELDNKVKMSEIADLMVRCGFLESGSSSGKASAVIKQKLDGTLFTMATEDQKLKLKSDLEKTLERKAS